MNKTNKFFYKLGVFFFTSTLIIGTYIIIATQTPLIINDNLVGNMSDFDTSAYIVNAIMEHKALSSNITQLNDTAYEINNTCTTETCKAFEVAKYVDETIKHVHQLPDINKTSIYRFEEMLEKNYGDCKEKAMLFKHTYEKTGGLATYMFQKGHVCVLYQAENSWKDYNCIEDRGIKFVAPVS